RRTSDRRRAAACRRRARATRESGARGNRAPSRAPSLGASQAGGRVCDLCASPLCRALPALGERMGGSPERAGPQLQSGATGRKLSPQFSPRGLLAGIRVSDRRVLQLCLSITPSRSTLRSFVSTVQPRLL